MVRHGDRVLDDDRFGSDLDFFDHQPEHALAIGHIERLGSIVEPAARGPRRATVERVAADLTDQQALQQGRLLGVPGGEAPILVEASRPTGRSRSRSSGGRPPRRTAFRQRIQPSWNPAIMRRDVATVILETPPGEVARLVRATGAPVAVLAREQFVGLLGARELLAVLERPSCSSLTRSGVVSGRLTIER